MSENYEVYSVLRKMFDKPKPVRNTECLGNLDIVFTFILSKQDQILDPADLYKAVADFHTTIAEYSRDVLQKQDILTLTHMFYARLAEVVSSAKNKSEVFEKIALEFTQHAVTATIAFCSTQPLKR